MLRKTAYRSRKEIDAEKYAVKALPGSFAGVTSYRLVQAWEASRR